MAAELTRRPSRLAAWWDSDLCWSFRHTPSAMISAALLLLIIAGAVHDHAARKRSYELLAGIG